MPALYQELKTALGEISDIGHASALLGWDQQTFMPPKGAAARGRQLATLSAIAHEKYTAKHLGELGEQLAAGKEPLSANEKKSVEEFLYGYRRATKLPTEFVREMTEAQSGAFHAWVEAKKTSHFPTFAPWLEKMVGFARRTADYYGYTGSPYNALLEDYERGMTADQLRDIFGVLRKRQSALVAKIVASSHQPDLEFLKQSFPEKHQNKFGMIVLADLGYDMDAGRLDKAPHPFTTNFDIEDVRITTRFHEDDLFSALMSTVHEAGHGMFEQGFRKEDRDTGLAASPSLGIHESQSRMWENIVGRSRSFWTHYLPILKAFFPAQLKGVDLDKFHRAVNHAKPSLVRVEADEVTYNLHIILRFEIEVALIEGTLKVADIPEAWNAKMKDFLGLTPPNDAQGCLQDVHWSYGSIGYFPTYTLGNLYASQFMEKIEKDIPNLWQGIEKAQFAPLLDWLRRNIHTVGRRRTAPELVKDVTGSLPSPEPYLRYLEKKYGDLYKL